MPEDDIAKYFGLKVSRNFAQNVLDRPLCHLL